MPTTRDALPFYRQIIGDAWKLSITHKYLWFFGFFATFVGYGGASEIILGAYDRLTKFVPATEMIQQSPLLLLPGFATVSAIVNLSPYPIVSLTLFSLAILLLFVVFAWIISVSIGALVVCVRKIERGGSPTFGEGVKAGSAAAIRVFSLIAGSKLAIGLVFILTGANLIHLLADGTFVSLFFFLLSFVLFTLLAITVSILSIYSVNAAAVENLPVVPSIADALRILRKHWLISVEMVIVLIIVDVIVGLLTLLLAMILSVPLVFLFFIAALIKSTALMTVVMAVTVIVLIAVVALAGSFLTTMQAAAWSLLWIRLSGRDAHLPKVIRLANWLQDRLRG